MNNEPFTLEPSPADPQPPREFPILKPYGIDFKKPVCPRDIRWDALNEEQAQINHGQSLSRLAERGGLSPDEAIANIERRPWRAMLIEDAIDAIEPYVLR